MVLNPRVKFCLLFKCKRYILRSLYFNDTLILIDGMPSVFKSSIVTPLLKKATLSPELLATTDQLAIYIYLENS
jgi:hypothetical protein